MKRETVVKAGTDTLTPNSSVNFLLESITKHFKLHGSHRSDEKPLIMFGAFYFIYYINYINYY